MGLAGVIGLAMELSAFGFALNRVYIIQPATVR
jgi:hypothetical protein